MNFIPNDKIAEVRDEGSSNALRFGTVHFSKAGNCLSVIWDEDEDHVEEQLDKNSVILLVDRPLPVGTRISYQGLDGSVTGSKKLVTVHLLNQHHQHMYLDEKGREKFTQVGYVDKSPTEMTTVLPMLKEASLHPWLGHKFGDHVLYQGWAGVISGGKVAIKYRFENGSDIRLESIKDLKEMEKSPGIFTGMRVNRLSTAIIEHGQWSRGLRPYNNIIYRNKAAIVAGIDVVSLDVVWIEKIRPTTTEATPNSAPPPPTTLEGEKVISNVFVFADPNTSSEKFQIGSTLKVRWSSDLTDNIDNWRQRFINGMSPSHGKNRNYGNNDDDDNDESESETDEPSFKKSRPQIEFSQRDWVAVRVFLTQTVLDVLFDDGSIQTGVPSWRIFEIMNNHPSCRSNSVVGLLSFPDVPYQLGDVVQDLTDLQEGLDDHYEKYGMVLRTHAKLRTVDVNWVILSGTGPNPRIRQVTTNVSQYDIQPLNRFQWLKLKPQIVVGKGIYEGVIIGQNAFLGKMIIQCAEGPRKEFFPHELAFLEKKAEIGPSTGKISIRQMKMPPDCKIPNKNYYTQNDEFSVNLLKVEVQDVEKYRYFTSMKVPDDHSFASKPSQASAMSSPESYNYFTNYIEKEVEVLRNAIMESGSGGHTPTWPVYIERFMQRMDLLTISVIGTKGTVYEDIPLFLDVFLPFGFWDWESNDCAGSLRPQVVVKTGRVVFPSWIHPAIDQTNSCLSYPDECLTQHNPGSVIGFLYHVVHHFTENCLCAEPLLQDGGPGPGVNLGLGRNGNVHQENNNGHNNNNTATTTTTPPHVEISNPFNFEDMIKSRDYNEAALVALSDYVHSMLCCPPSSWKGFAESYFRDRLPKICRRILEISRDRDEYKGIEFSSAETFDILNLNDNLGSKHLIHPLSISFTLAVDKRMNFIHPFLMAALCVNKPI